MNTTKNILQLNKKSWERYPMRLEKETNKKKDKYKSIIEGKKNNLSKKLCCN